MYTLTYIFDHLMELIIVLGVAFTVFIVCVAMLAGTAFVGLMISNLLKHRELMQTFRHYSQSFPSYSSYSAEDDGGDGGGTMEELNPEDYEECLREIQKEGDDADLEERGEGGSESKKD